MADTDKLDARVPITSSDELGSLAAPTLFPPSCDQMPSGDPLPEIFRVGDVQEHLAKQS